MGLHYTLTAPPILAPLIGGQIHSLTSFPVLFATASLMGIFGVWVSWQMPRGAQKGQAPV